MRIRTGFNLRRLATRAAVVGAVVAPLAALQVPAVAQQFPTRPVTVIVPYAAGGPTDLSSRGVAEGMGQFLGQPVVVENRPGANGRIGMDAVRRTAPDGYTMLFAAVQQTVAIPNILDAS